jgi:drug/metabolite transporter (DMT)-like permease
VEVKRAAIFTGRALIITMSTFLPEGTDRFSGIFLLLAAAFLFALSTVFLKFALAAPYLVAPSVATFARFLVGFLMFSSYMAVKGQSLRPNRGMTVLMRAVLNTLAVILLFTGIKYTTVTKSNILNLTYPAFIFLVAPYITGEKQKSSHYLFLLITLIGAALIVLSGRQVDFSRINKGDLLSLASGIVSAFAISGLREARKYDSSQIILFYQMSFGSLATLVWMLPSFVVPKGRGLGHVIIAAVLSNVGQLCITEGYRSIGASLGAIVLESGILFAALLGITIFRDPLNLSILFGGLLILFSIAGVSGILERKPDVKQH